MNICGGPRYLGGRRGFSSISVMGSLGGGRSTGVPVCQPMGRPCGAGGFSSVSLNNFGGGSRKVAYGHVYGRMGVGGPGSPCRSEGIRGVSVDERLLKPLSVGVDPEEHKARTHEKEEMKTLNNQFACFIDKVRSLEQQNKVLSTKWELLSQCVQPTRKNLEVYYETFLASLKKQLESLLSERGKLEHEQKNMQQLVEEYRSKYEEEVNRRTTAENEFVVLKKIYHILQELNNLNGQLCDTSVVLKMDNTRDLNVDLIIKNVETWYQNIAHASKQEAEAFYHNKVSCGGDCFKHEIAELNRMVQRLHTDLENTKKQVASLQSAICDAEQRGDIALKDARSKHVELQNAYQQAKDKLACLLRDYQEVLNTKLALDIEIATYKAMLEGEESRYGVTATGSGVGYGIGHGSGVGTVGGFSSRSGGYSSSVTNKHVVTSGGYRHSSGVSTDGSCISGHHGGLHHVVGGAGNGVYSTGASNMGSSGIGMHSSGMGGPYAAGSLGGMAGAAHGGSRMEGSTTIRNVHVTSSARKYVH
uniref:IF rod domain-containing protein n=1 Tax=Salvator merianae TaxID=96440 RepID=A0A8D0BVF8_SALMN